MKQGMTKENDKSKYQNEVAEKFDETKSREEEWALAGEKVDEKAGKDTKKKED